MAVPKKRTTSASQNQRRSHHALKNQNLMPSANGSLVPRRLLKAVSLGLIKKKG